MNRSKLVFIIFLTAAALSLAAFLSCGDDDDDSTSSGQADDNAGDDDTSGEPFVLASVKFGPGDDIPEEYTCDNEDYVHGVSPPLSWANSPEETVFFALTMFDPDASDTPHWGVFDIPPDESGLADGLRPDDPLPGNAWEALNYTDEAGYAGPCPPTGETHEYVFTIYALNEGMPDFDTTPGVSEMESHINERLIDSASLSARYSR